MVGNKKNHPTIEVPKKLSDCEDERERASYFDLCVILFTWREREFETKEICFLLPSENT